MQCNATLTTTVETDDVVTYRTRSGVGWSYWPDHIHDGVAVVRRGDRLMRLDVTTLTCAYTINDHREPHVRTTGGGQVKWTDSTPDATPHTPPARRSWHVDEAGAGPPPPADVCPRCKGKGKVLGTGEQWMKPCPSCGGTGDRPADVCPDCGSKMDRLHPAYMKHQCYRCPSCGGTGDRPAVTDEQVDAALSAWDYHPSDDDHEAMRAALEAAAEVRPEPAVTDAMIQAMHDALVEDAGFDPNSDEDREIMLRAALEAAARARSNSEK